MTLLPSNRHAPVSQPQPSESSDQPAHDVKCLRGARSPGSSGLRETEFVTEVMTKRPPTPDADQPPRPSAKADWVRALQRTANVDIGSRRTLAAIIDEMAGKYPDRPALTGDDSALTYGELAALSRRYSRWALDHGLRSGDRVALMMDNHPDYVAIWIGLSRIGVVVALINPRLLGASLVHCISVAASDCVIVDAANLGVLVGALGSGPALRVYVHGEKHGEFERIDAAIERFPARPLGAEEGERPSLSDVALLIFTSGTTGMPKAALVSHYRIVMWSEWFAGIIDARVEDRLYDCLPLCHSVGGVVGIGSALVVGASVIVRRNFSATRLWADVIAARATIFLYIGEPCRYLLAVQGKKEAPRHRLRLCFGNGLRSDVWEAFAKDFSIPKIIEFYARPKVAFRYSTWRESRARSAASRRTWRIARRWLWSNSTLPQSSQFAGRWPLHSLRDG